MRGARQVEGFRKILKGKGVSRWGNFKKTLCTVQNDVTRDLRYEVMSSQILAAQPGKKVKIRETQFFRQHQDGQPSH